MRSTFVTPLILCCAMAMLGCGSPVVTPSKPGKPDTPVVAKGTIGEYLATAIRKERVTNSSKLDLMITHLRSLGELTDMDVAKFQSLFPDIKQKERTLTPQDATTIEGL